MKVRIRGNSVRIRVTKSEVARLSNGFPVQQRTQFGPSSVLISSVSPSADVTNPAVEFKDAALSVRLPAAQSQTWARSAHVAIEATQDVGSGTQLAILVEKDFECIHSRAEQDADAFPNPRLKEWTGTTWRQIDLTNNARAKTSSDATLAILAGGKSRRMGQPKAELTIDKQPILTYLLERFLWNGPTLLVIAPCQNLPAGAHLFDAVSTDAVSGEGPLRGVLTALEHAKTEFVLVATVDMPAIAPGHLHHVHSLLRQRPQSDVVMLHQHQQPGAVEPFPSAYRCRPSAELIRAQLEAGMRAVRDLRKLPCVDVLPAPSDWLPPTWANLNFPEDVSEFLRSREFRFDS